ncbi:MAG: calcium/sodium antiporter [Leptospirales bacterium]
MPESWTLYLFLPGIILLIKGADWLVDGSSSIAGKMGISQLVIGLTFVAFGTSAPELAVSSLASIAGNSGVALGNILGSNIANILFILGTAAVIYPLKVEKNTAFREIPFSMLAALVLAVLVNDVVIDGASVAELTRSDGLIMLAFFTLFLYYVFSIAKNSKENEVDVADLTTSRAVIFIIVGIAGLTFGGNLIVKAAVMMAESWGLSERIIGLTVVAIGTSLPELATSAVAAYKKNTDIAIGNVVGSNIFNIFWVLGIAATIRPLPGEEGVNLDIGLVVLSSALLMGLLFFRKKHMLNRGHGILFLLLYFTYLTTLVVLR